MFPFFLTSFKMYLKTKNWSVFIMSVRYQSFGVVEYRCERTSSQLTY